MMHSIWYVISSSGQDNKGVENMYRKLVLTKSITLQDLQSAVYTLFHNILLLTD